MAASSKVFSLEGKSLKLTTAEDLEPHIAELRAMEDLEEVRLLGNSLGVGACKVFGEILATKKTLRVANLADIFTGRVLSEIPDALTHLLTSILNLPELGTVDLSDNAFGFNTKGPLIAFLRAHVPLRHLYLNNNGLGPDAGADIANALSELHARKEEARKAGDQNVPDLETVVCGRNRLENGSMLAWARTYRLHDKIRVVRMTQNGIRPHGIYHLLNDGLRHAAGIQVIDLQDNTFTRIGAVALAKLVPLWRELRELGISDSLVGARGGLLVIDALARGQCQKLEVLHLQYNEINVHGLRALAAAAKDALPALRKIELDGNRFSEEDESIIALQGLFEERKERLGGDIVHEDDWGLDSLEELDDEEDGDEEEEDEEPTAAEIADKLMREAAETQKEPVVQVKDKEVDDLAAQLEKTGI